MTHLHGASYCLDAYRHILRILPSSRLSSEKDRKELAPEVDV